MNALRPALILAFSLSFGLRTAAWSAEPGETHYVPPQITHADYGELNLVMPITADDDATWLTRMGHAYNAINTAPLWHGQVHMTIVLYGSGVKLLTHQNDRVAEMVERLRSAGAKFAVCNNALKGQDLDWHTLNGVNQADIVPAGVLEVPYLEAQGFRLVPE